MSSTERKRAQQRGRLTTGTYSILLHDVLDSERVMALSGNATKLLVDFVRQYNGYNNGSLVLAWSRMSKRGWRSQGTLWRALGELLDAGVVVQTRQGSMHCAGLYALTWKAIDANPKHGLGGTATAPGGWRDPVTDGKKGSDRPRYQWRNPKRSKKPSAPSISAETVAFDKTGASADLA